MKLLALDTSSLACTVGVTVDGSVNLRHELQPREHTRLLMPMIREVLDEAAVELRELDGIVLGNGPGSFIGMRIAASVAQGLAFGSDLKIAAVSSLAAVALEASAGDGLVAVAQDAHMQEVYLGLYRVADGVPVAVMPERLQACERIAELADVEACIAAGFGWQRFPTLFEANRSDIAATSEILYPHAAALLALGQQAFDAGQALAPDAVMPAYLRQKVAEIPKDRVS